MCTVLLPPGVNPIAVKYIISYHIISYFCGVAESVHSVREEVFQSQEVAKRVPTERTGSVAP